jgi:hypothetical protein
MAHAKRSVLKHAANEGVCHGKTLDLQSVLKGDVAAAGSSNHIEKLMLTPKETPDGVVLEVSGEVEICL